MDARLASSPCFSAASSAWASDIGHSDQDQCGRALSGDLLAVGTGRGFRRTRQDPHNAVLAHVHGLLVAVPDQLGGDPRSRSCQHIINVRAEAVPGFLEPDVAHDPVAGEQCDGHPFPQPVLGPGRYPHRQPGPVQFTVGAQVLRAGVRIYADRAGPGWRPCAARRCRSRRWSMPGPCWRRLR